MQRIRRALAITATTALLIGAGSVAFGVDDSKEVRQADFDAAPAGLSDTRSTGHYDFLEEGLHVWTEGNTSTDKVAEYFPVSKTLAEVGEPTMDWYGTDNQPGMQLVVDLDNDGTVDGILVGEPKFYSNRWWANNQLNTFIASDTGNTAPGANDGYQHSGPLSDWRSAYPDATIKDYGFSLGSGVKGDGVLRHLTLDGAGQKDFIFTDEDATPAAVTPEKHTHSAAVTAKAPDTGDSFNRQLIARLYTNPCPSNDTCRGTKVTWKITVDGGTRYTSTAGWGESTYFRQVFSKDGGSRTVKIYRNGTLVRTKTITTR